MMGMMLLFWAGVILLGVFAFRAWSGAPAKQEANTALDLLNARYARGEIDKAEYEEKRAAIGR